jgi:hypothetical protein
MDIDAQSIETWTLSSFDAREEDTKISDQAHACVLYQRSFRITNRLIDILIDIRRQVI